MSQLLPILPGTLTPNACFNSEQQRLVAFAEAMNAILDSGQAFYNYGASKPDPENNAYPWFNTSTGRWYTYSGGWISPVGPSYDLNERRLWVGDITQLQTYDGGDSGAPSDRSGPMWEVDADFAAHFPVGPGVFAGGTAVAVGGTGGADRHTLTLAELPATVAIPQRLIPSGDPYLQHDTDDNSDVGVNRNATTDVVGGGQPHNNLPPYRGIYFIKRTGRTNYFIP